MLPRSRRPSSRCGCRRLPGLCWLDGEAAHRDGRFSFLGAEPVERIRVPFACDGDPLAAFDAHGARRRAPAREQRPRPACASSRPSCPRWVGYVAYDAHYARNRPRASRGRPSGRRSRSRATTRCSRSITLHRPRVRGRRRPRRVPGAAPARRSAPPFARRRARVGALRRPTPRSTAARSRAALDHIARGDVYQVNLARCFRAPFEGAPLALWAALRAASPVPLGFYYDDGERVLMGRTMERFLRWERAARRLSTRPIKGTLARRFAADAADDARAAALTPQDASRCSQMRSETRRSAGFGNEAPNHQDDHGPDDGAN